MLPKGFVYVDEAVPGVRWDAKYAGCDNFMGRPADGYLVNRAVCTAEAAAALANAAALLKPRALYPFVFDAYRPARAVEDFCRWTRDESDCARKSIHYPRVEKRELIPQGYIAGRSGHSRGSVIDLSLCREDGSLLDMGGIFDLMDPVSRHGAPGLSPEQTENRELLRAVMLQSGFADYDCEWWHYRLRGEPYPDTYFDFVIE